MGVSAAAGDGSVGDAGGHWRTVRGKSREANVANERATAVAGAACSGARGGVEEMTSLAACQAREPALRAAAPGDQS